MNFVFLRSRILFIFFTTLLVLECVVFSSVLAQTENGKIGMGLGFGIWQTQEETDIEPGFAPLEVYYDHDFDEQWLKFRVGYNTIRGKLSFDAFNKSWDGELTTQSIFFAYRYTRELARSVKVHGIAGLAYMLSSLNMNNDIDTINSAGIGTILGGGIMYYIDIMAFGLQMELFSGDGDFDGNKMAVGSTQLSIIVL